MKLHCLFLGSCTFLHVCPKIMLKSLKRYYEVASSLQDILHFNSFCGLDFFIFSQVVSFYYFAYLLFFVHLSCLRSKYTFKPLLKRKRLSYLGLVIKLEIKCLRAFENKNKLQKETRQKPNIIQ